MENKNSTDLVKVPIYIQIIAALSISLLFAGFFVSRALMSIGMIGLVLPFFLYNFRQHAHEILRSWLFWGSVLLIPVYLFSGLYSDDMGYFTHRMQLKLSLLCFPLAYVGLRSFPAKFFSLVFYFILLALSLETIGAIITYISDFSDITERYIAGRVMPLPFHISHTRYSLMLACEIFIAAFLWKKKDWFYYPVLEKCLTLLSGILALGFLHLLAVRSGLLAFYLGLVMWVLMDTLNQKKYLRGVLMLAAIFIGPVILYFTVPTLHNKINYSVRDINNYLSGENVYAYSDGNRLLSMKLAYDIGKESPVWGIGLGDVQNEMFASYQKNHPELPPDQWLIPHSQFFYVWLAAGIPGVLALLALILTPFFNAGLRKEILPLLILTVFASSFISEATLENQLGSLTFGFFFWVSCAWKSSKF